MIQESVLMRTADSISAYISKYVKRVSIDKREEMLELFDNMHLLFPHWVIMSCPMMHPGLYYISKNGPHVFGYDHDYLLSHCSMGKHFQNVHDTDQQDLHECLSVANEILQTTIEDHTNLRFVFHYRYKKANGQYIYLHDEKAAVNLQGEGNLYYALFKDITAERTFTGVKLEIYRQDQNLIKVKEFKPASKSGSLSKREGELVTLMKQGLSTKEIAWHLNISHHTVRNIKSKLFEKYNVNNSIELLNMTG